MTNRLRVLRAEVGWSQADLAVKLEVSRQSVNGKAIEEIFEEDGKTDSGQ
jgi:DNA-binding XRE family transcriptional regulator